LHNAIYLKTAGHTLVAL